MTALGILFHSKIRGRRRYHGVVNHQRRILVLFEITGWGFEVQMGLGKDAESYFLLDSESES